MIEEYKRTLSIYKITDGEYTDKYIEYYLFMIEQLSYTSIYKYSEYVNVYYTVDNNGNYIIKFFIDIYNKHIVLSEDVYKCLRNHQSINSYVMVMDTVNDYISNSMSLENYQSFFMSESEYKMYANSIK